MKKVLFVFIAVVFLTVPMFAQEEGRTSNVALYGSLGGYGLLYGIGGQYLITPNVGLNLNYSQFTVTVEVDDGFTTRETDVTVSLVPAFFSFYTGTNHRLYLDAGVNYITFEDDNLQDDIIIIGNDGFFGIGGIGYNYHAQDGGFFFKIGPAFVYGGGELLIWGGISLGVAF
jgi:outer membrane protein W